MFRFYLNWYALLACILKFQYILCFGFTYIACPFDSYCLLFQYILCFGFTKIDNTKIPLVFHFNTSYVSVLLVPFIYIFLYFRDFNTSYVSVLQTYMELNCVEKRDFNTSYVSVLQHIY